MKSLKDYILHEKMMLSNYSKYAEAATEALEARPNKDSPDVLRSWAVLRKHNLLMFKRLSAWVDVIWTEEDPYQSQAQMKREVEETGKLYINTGFSRNLLSGWSEEDNWKFRAVHDYVVHIGGNVDFSQRGEIKAYNVHAKIVPPAALDALFSEVVGQAAYATVRGRFLPVQKAAKLYGFDYKKVGLIDWLEYRKNFTVNPIRYYSEDEIDKIIRKVGGVVIT